MLKPVLILVLLAVFAGGGFFLYQNLQTRSAPPAGGSTPIPQITKTPSPTQTSFTVSPTPTLTACQILEQGSADVPPLYKEGVTWQAIKKDEFLVPLEDRDQLMSGCSVKTIELQYDVSSKVRGYYSKALTNLGWVSVGGGDRPGGSIASWSKNNKYFVVKVDPVRVESLSQVITLFYTP